MGTKTILSIVLISIMTALLFPTQTLTGVTPYYSNAAFNKCMPLSVLYTATAHLLALFMKPFPFRVKVETLHQEDCFSPSKTENFRIHNEPKTKSPLQRHVALVTGSNTGIGFETASSLVDMGYDVVLACRSRNKGEKAAEAINARRKSSTSGKAIFLHPLDLSSLSSVKDFLKIYSESYQTLNILINNAGINTTGKSEDNMDLCFQTNYLGHYLLTRSLVPHLLKAKNYYLGYVTDESNKIDKPFEAGRIVNLSSVTHHFARPDEKRIVNGIEVQSEQFDEAWWKGCATPGVSDNTYKESKLAAALFTEELNNRYSQHGLRAVTVNPGAVNSDIWRNYPKFLLKYILGPIFNLLYLSTKEGSKTSLVGAVGKLPENAIYLQPYWHPRSKPKKGSDKKAGANKSFRLSYRLHFPVFEMLGLFVGHAVTEPRLPPNLKEQSKTLWKVSEDLVGL